jgi:hypothetical protein
VPEAGPPLAPGDSGMLLLALEEPEWHPTQPPWWPALGPTLPATPALSTFNEPDRDPPIVGFLSWDIGFARDPYNDVDDLFAERDGSWDG